VCRFTSNWNNPSLPDTRPDPDHITNQTNLRTNITPSDLGIITTTSRRIRSRILHIVKQNAVAILAGRACHLVGVGLRNAGYIVRAQGRVRIVSIRFSGAVESGGRAAFGNPLVSPSSSDAPTG
jgi:hypothetical protein